MRTCPNEHSNNIFFRVFQSWLNWHPRLRCRWKPRLSDPSRGRKPGVGWFGHPRIQVDDPKKQRHHECWLCCSPEIVNYTKWKGAKYRNIVLINIISMQSWASLFNQGVWKWKVWILATLKFVNATKMTHHTPTSDSFFLTIIWDLWSKQTLSYTHQFVKFHICEDDSTEGFVDLPEVNLLSIHSGLG